MIHCCSWAHSSTFHHRQFEMASANSYLFFFLPPAQLVDSLKSIWPDHLSEIKVATGRESALHAAGASTALILCVYTLRNAKNTLFTAELMDPWVQVGKSAFLRYISIEGVMLPGEKAARALCRLAQVE